MEGFKDTNIDNRGLCSRFHFRNTDKIGGLAFTLAEVLITLSIIGIVAALTIPTLISKYNRQFTITHLKKAYSVFSQAVQLSTIDNGYDWDIPFNEGYDETLAALNKYILPYIKSAKVCQFSEGNCFAEEMYGLNGTPLNENSPSNVYVTLVDGTVAKFSAANSTEHGIIYTIKVDVNGIKKPNILGHDIFEFLVIDGRLQPSYKYIMEAANPIDAALKNAKYGCNTRATGAYCSTVVVLSGWEFPDNYPVKF